MHELLSGHLNVWEQTKPHHVQKAGEPAKGFLKPSETLLSLPALALLIALAALPSSAASAAPLKYTNSTDRVNISTQWYTFNIDLSTGEWNAAWPDNKPFIARARSEWDISASGSEKITTITSTGPQQRAHKFAPFMDPWGKGRALEISFDNPAPKSRLTLSFRFYEDQPYFTLATSYRNNSQETIKAAKFTPLKTSNENRGGVYVGADPAATWILEDGYNTYFDFYVRLIPGSESSNSNWNSAIYDPATGRAAVFGFITVDRALVNILTHNAPGANVADPATGWKAFSGLRAVSDYEPSKPIPPGAALNSETLLIMPDMTSPHRALETFATAAAARYPRPPQTGPIPTGWNVWATGYHHAITQNNILENAQWAHERLQPFGMTTFQIDDGWQTKSGDWEPNNNFPGGMKKIAEKITALGFRPGLWLMPFCVDAGSNTAKEHPDWLAPKGKIAKTTMPKDWEILDLGKPEVKQSIRSLFRKITKEWGYKVLKIDFLYYALGARNFNGGANTNLEEYRDAHRIIREEIGPGAHLIEVSVPIYTALGYADSMRIGLDNIPDWADDEGPYAQGLKPLVRNIARRYYLNHRVWINHPDMFYLGAPEEKTRWAGKQLTTEEARAYATLVALLGGVTKIGDTFINLNAQQTDLYRRLLPVYNAGARPIDLFEMEYPLLWDLPVRAGGQDWHTVGVFNWGKNRRWGKLVEEATATVTMSGPALGLDPNSGYIAYGFWSDSWFGEFNGAGGLAITLPPRRAESIAVRKKTGAPQFLSTNRHITQGGTDLVYESWSQTANTLYITQKLDAGFQYITTLYAPDGYTAKTAEADGVPLTPSQTGRIVRLTAKAAASTNITWIIRFEKN